MSLRLIQIFAHERVSDRIAEVIKEYEPINTWRDRLSEGRCLVNALMATERTEELLDTLERDFAATEDFRVILLPVEAAIPRPKPPEKEPAKAAQKAAGKKPVRRVSREELYADIAAAVRPSWTFIIFVILSAVVASIGLLRDNVAVVIGAMVIAPLLGPNVGLALATTLADADLGRRALKTLGLGLLTVLLSTALIGCFVSLGSELPREMVSRTVVNYSDIILALAAGAAACLSFTKGLPGALIGVMVAVALLPPAATLGMLLGAGSWQSAFGAMLLLFTNLICINLAGVLTFLLQGVRPRNWWEANKAKRATRIALVLWSVLLLILWFLIYLAHQSAA